MVKIFCDGTKTDMSIVDAFGLLKFSQVEKALTMFADCGVKQIVFDGDDIEIDFVAQTRNANHGADT